MTEPFKPGTTVRLKSGGPLMTVDKTTTEQSGDLVWCIWFDEKHKRHDGKFAPYALRADDGGPVLA